MQNPRLWIWGGVAGVVSLCCYILAITVSWPETQTGTSVSLVVVSGFPILGIVYSFALYNYVAMEREKVSNRLGIIFAVAAFTTLLAMIVVQLAVVASIADITRDLDVQVAKAIQRGLRMIDHGLDVTWDFLGGMMLVCWGLAIRRRKGFGTIWGIASLVFGIAIVVLNAATFPYPPADRGLFDLGPVIGVFMLAMSVRLAFLGRGTLRIAETSP